MIYVDRRRGSGEFVSELEALTVKVQTTTLPFGDFAFYGNGPHGSILVGVERKTVREATDSMMGDGRFMGRQVPGLVEMYDWRWLFIEGRWKVQDGEIAVPWGRAWRGVCPSSNFLRWLVGLEMAGFHLRYPSKVAETLAHLVALYWWFQKSWDKHKSYLALYHKAKSLAREPSWFPIEQDALVGIYACIDGVGIETAKVLARRYPTLDLFSTAVHTEELLEVHGVGPSILKAAGKVVHG